MPRVALVLTAACVGGLTVGISPALGAFPGANGKIAFESNRHGGDGDIWTMDPDGRGLANLTVGSRANDSAPGWSADGQKILFMSDRKTARNPDPRGTRGPDFEIFVMNADGSQPRQLTFNTFDDEDPAWSPDGQQIVFQRDFNPVRGKNDYDILTMKANGTGQRNLTKSRGKMDTQANWSPTGQKIVFTSDRDGDNEIYTMGPDGSNRRQLTFNRLSEEFPNWSPDGRTIAFHRDRNDNLDVYTIRADGGGLRRLTSRAGGDGLPAWSPDGALIAFLRERGNALEIFTMNADGGAQLNRTNSRKFNFAPDWQPLP